MRQRGGLQNSDSSSERAAPLVEKVAGKDGLSDYLGVFVFSLLLLLSNVPVYAVARFTQTVKQIRRWQGNGVLDETHHRRMPFYVADHHPALLVGQS